MIHWRGHLWEIDGRPTDAAIADVVARARADRTAMVVWAVTGPTAADDAAAASAGLSSDRDVLQMRADIPVAAALRGSANRIATRPFVPGADDAAFIETNNRAFADHPEQGGWTPDVLAARTAEPWFDPDGFRLHEADDRVAGFCWTKVHTDEEPPAGEIYAIGVDPDFQGRGLGRGLALAGLDWMGDHDLTRALLYTDAINTAALGLYESLGFTVVERRRVYVGPHSD